MSSNAQQSHWVERAIGGVVVAGIAYLLLGVWSTWDLNAPARFFVSGVLGALFFAAGRSIWKWLEAIFHHS